MSCCGGNSRPTSKAVKQSEPANRQVAMQSPKQMDTGNPVNNHTQNITNVVRANEINRNNYHSNHYGLGR